jgi:hypothetical protein
MFYVINISCSHVHLNVCIVSEVFANSPFFISAEAAGALEAR